MNTACATDPRVTRLDNRQRSQMHSLFTVTIGITAALGLSKRNRTHDDMEEACFLECGARRCNDASMFGGCPRYKQHASDFASLIGAAEFGVVKLPGEIIFSVIYFNYLCERI